MRVRHVSTCLAAVVLLAAAPLVTSGLAVHATATAWSTAVVVPTGTGTVNSAPQLLANADGTSLLNAYAFASGGTVQVRVNASTDGGETWTDPIGVSIASGNAADLKVAASRDLTHVSAVWSDATSNELFVASSRDSGVTWSQAHVISSGSLPTDPDIAVSADGTHAYVVWASAESPLVIRMVSTSNGGVTWTAPANSQRLSASAGPDFDFPEVSTSADGSKVAVTWVDTTGALVQFDYSADSGATWTAPIAGFQINSGGQNVSQSLLAMNDAGTSIVVSWYDATSHALFSRTTNDGSTWVSSQISVATSVQVPFGLFELAMAPSNQTTYLVWRSSLAAPITIAVSSSTDAGLSWRTPSTLDSGAGVNYPNLAVSSNGAIAQAIWQDGNPAGAIKTSRTSDSGANWSTTASIASSQSWIPAVTTASDGSWTAATYLSQDSATLFTSRLAPAPTVSVVAPSSGYVSGGDTITITGTGFKNGAAVRVGSGSATSVSVVNDTTITAVTPAADAAGAVAVTVTNVDSQSATMSSGFTYSALKTQAPAKDLKIAKKIAPKKWVKLIKVPVRTNAGQHASPVVTATIKGKPVGQVSKKFFKTKRKGGYLQVYSSGKKKLTVLLSLSAPPIEEYGAYDYSKIYTVKKK